MGGQFGGVEAIAGSQQTLAFTSPGSGRGSLTGITAQPRSGAN